jgi:hypothetical protein
VNSCVVSSSLHGGLGSSAYRQGDSRGTEQPDLEFWQGIFDQARDVGFQDGSPTNQPVALAFRYRSSLASQGSTQSFVQVDTNSELPDQSESPLTAPLNHASARGDSSMADGLPVAVFTGCVPFMSGDTSLVLTVNGSEAAERDLPSSSGKPRSVGVVTLPASPSEPVQLGMRAHVAQLASGELKVTLRAHRGLSVAQALAAAALARLGLDSAQAEIREVILNGATVHRGGACANKHESEHPSFEFRC